MANDDTHEIRTITQAEIDHLADRTFNTAISKLSPLSKPQRRDALLTAALLRAITIEMIAPGSTIKPDGVQVLFSKSHD